MMNIFLINDKIVYDIINSLTINEETKKLLIKAIIHYNSNFVEFIYDIFKYYTPYYVPYHVFYDKNIYLDCYILSKVENAIKEISYKHKILINPNDIFVIDVYNIFEYKCIPVNLCFEPYFYDLMYERLSDLVGSKDAYYYIDEIFDAIEDIFNNIESNLIFYFNKYNYKDSYIVVHNSLEYNLLKTLILYPESMEKTEKS